MKIQDSKLKFAFTEPDGIAPVRATKNSAGIDLHIPFDLTLDASEEKLINLKVAFEIPEGHYGMISPRSGLATKKIVCVVAPGIIDSDYRGPIKVQLWNRAGIPYHFKRGDRVVQLVVNEYKNVSLEETSLEELTSTERGSGGFGSTGA